jgi:hypothetical protein
MIENGYYGIGVCAPTHKAKGVLEQRFIDDNINIKCETIDSLLSMRVGYDGQFHPPTDEETIKRMPIKKMKYIFIDEASMVGDDKIALIMQHKPEKCKVIFMGDEG